MQASAFDQVVEAFTGKLSELKAITLLRLEGASCHAAKYLVFFRGIALLFLVVASDDDLECRIIH